MSIEKLTTSVFDRMASLARMVLALPLVWAVSGCAVVSVAGAAVGAAVSVTGAVVSTGVKVTGKVIEKTIDAATPASPAEAE